APGQKAWAIGPALPSSANDAGVDQPGADHRDTDRSPAIDAVLTKCPSSTPGLTLAIFAYRRTRSMARASSARTLDRLPHPGRGGRHVDVRHAERCERIQDGVDDGARRADGGALAGALDAERVRRARHV